jgi:hypothetical protein
VKIKLKHLGITCASLIVLAIVGIVVFFMTGPHFPQQTKQEKQFEKSLKKAIKSGAKEVHLKDLTDFEWERVYRLGPYQLETFDGIQWNGTSCLSEDSQWGLLFVDSNKDTISICISKKIAEGSLNCVFKEGAKAIFVEETVKGFITGRDIKQTKLKITGQDCKSPLNIKNNTKTRRTK